MPSRTCRLCSALLDDGAALTLEPAPAGAQHFLDQPEEDGSGNGSIALSIVQCSECGLVQSSSPEVAYYRQVISAAGLSPAMREHRAAQAKAFVEAHDLKGKPVVEIGCHSGYFLDILTRTGVVATGTESGAKESNPGRHARIVDSYPEPGKIIPGGPFSAFFCLNFLEHSPDPRAFLRGIRENLTEDGCGLIEVPNYAQQRRLGRVFDYIADHLCYFEADTLETTIALSGFVVEKIDETRNGENLEAWVRRRKPADLSEDASVIAATQKKLANWLADHRQAGRRVAIWGASHQALTLLARLQRKDAVGIFDSAEFKQGRFAPITRLPILKPTVEALRAVDCILIVAGGYEREIGASLRATFQFSGPVFFMSGSSIEKLEPGPGTTTS